MWLPENGQMVEGNAGGEKFFFAYDTQGRRVQKLRKIRNQTTGDWETVGTTRFVWDGWLLVAELDESNQLRRSNLWGSDLSNSSQGAGGVGGLLLTTDHAAQGGSQSHFALSDASGNVCALVDAQNGQVSARYAYGPFGEPLEATGPVAASNPWRFSTRYDDGTGLLYYGYRYYHPSTGRWISRDPLEEEGGLNLYGFVNNDPVNAVDAFGLQTLSFKGPRSQSVTEWRLPVPISYDIDMDVSCFYDGDLRATYHHNAFDHSGKHSINSATLLGQLLPARFKKYARLGPQVDVDYRYTISKVRPMKQLKTGPEGSKCWDVWFNVKLDGNFKYTLSYGAGPIRINVHTNDELVLIDPFETEKKTIC